MEAEIWTTLSNPTIICSLIVLKLYNLKPDWQVIVTILLYLLFPLKVKQMSEASFPNQFGLIREKKGSKKRFEGLLSRQHQLVKSICHGYWFTLANMYQYRYYPIYYDTFKNMQYHDWFVSTGKWKLHMWR